MVPTLPISGISVIRSVVDLAEIDKLRELPEMSSAGRPGARAFQLGSQLRRLIASDGQLGVLATHLMQRPVQAVRVLCFDKTPEMNWAVPWHQDRTIAVKTRVECEGFGPWSIKGGIPHVEPPLELLTGMVSLRLHLDDCPVENGPLQAISNSWQLGRIPAVSIKAEVDRGEIVVLTAAAGDVVAMRGLTIHASESSRIVGNLRVIHVDFTTVDLPTGLEWALD